MMCLTRAVHNTDSVVPDFRQPKAPRGASEKMHQLGF